MDRRDFLASAMGAGLGFAGVASAAAANDSKSNQSGTAMPEPSVRKRARLSDGDHIDYGIFGERGPFLFLGPHNYLTPQKRSGQENMTPGYIAGLSDRYRLIVADWPRGFGNSSPAKVQSMTRDNVIRDIHAIADDAGADRFAWWGYSFGGAVALQLARRNKRISAVMCGGWPPLWQPVSDLLGKLHARARELRSTSSAAAQPTFEYQMTLGSIAFYESISGQDDWQAIKEIECPRLVLHDVGDLLPAGKGGYGQPLDFAQRTRTAEADLKSLGWEVAWVDTGKGHLAMLDTKAMLAAFAPFFDRALLGRGGTKG